MGSETDIIFWRRTDLPALERLILISSREGMMAESTVICVENGGTRIDHRWRLSNAWRALSLDVEKWDAQGFSRLVLAREGTGWAVNGNRRADLVGADEPDLSVTPFCNTLPIRRLMAEQRASLTQETCYIDAASMTVARSRQRYDRTGAASVKYVDLVLYNGCEADLVNNQPGLVVSYQNLFERVTAQ